jgi:hypothetical protein
MYYACYQLSKLGLNVMPTARNAKGADILAYTADQKTFLTFQVKAMTKRSNISLGKSLDSVTCDWWLVVVNVYDEPTTYVMTPDEIRESARHYKDGHWAQGSAFDTDTTHNAWDRILASVDESNV